MFSSQKFFDFWAKIFQAFGQKTSKICENYLLRVQRNNLWLELFFKKFEALWIFYRNLWHGSQNSIYVSRVKYAVEIISLFFLSEFFRILSEKFLRLLAKKRQEFVKTKFYVSRGTICGLKFSLSFESFRIFCRNFWHGSRNTIYVSRVKIAEKKVSLFSFQNFFRFLSNNFSDFWPKNFNKFSKTTFYVSRGTICGLIFFLKNFEPFWIVYRNFWHGSQNSIYASRLKFAEEINFSFFFSEFFRFLSENFQTFGQKTSKICENYLLRVHRNNL